MNKTGINWRGFNVKSGFPTAADEKWVKGEPVEISQPVQITIRPQSSDISRIWWMRKKRNKFLWQGFNWGKVRWSLRVFSQGHTAQRDYSHWSFLLALFKSCNVPQITVLVPEPRKKRRENRVEMGKGRLYLSVNFVQISTTVLKTLAPPPFPPFRVKQTFEHPSRMNNLSPSSVRESDIPPPPSSRVILSSPPPSLHTKPPTSNSYCNE